MKNKDLFRLHEGFNQVKGLEGVRFALAVARNSRKVAEAIEDLEAAKATSEDFEVVREAEAALLQGHVLRDSEGQPVPGEEKGSFQLKDAALFAQAHKTFCEEHEDVLAQRKIQLALYDLVLEEEVSLTLHTVKEGDLPPQLTAEMAARIFEMIEEDE